MVLLKKGANRYIRDKQGALAAECPASFRYPILQALLTADPKTSFVHDAAKEGRYRQVLALFKLGCPYNFRDDRPGGNARTPLMSACEGGQIDTVRILLRFPEITQRGINLQDKLGLTALMLACSGGHTGVSFLLLSSGADRDVKDFQNKTAHAHAQTHGYATALVYLSQLVCVD